MKTLHDGKQLILKEDGDTLLLDVKLEGELTPAQIRKLDRILTPADEDSWFGDTSRKHEILALVRQIEMPFTSRAEEARARQQRVGGR